MLRTWRVPIVFCGCVWLGVSATCLGGPWYIQMVDQKPVGQGWVGDYTSLALDGSGKPRISYRHEPNQPDFKGQTVRYAAWNGAGWAIQEFDPGECASHATYQSLALDSLGRPHISYKWG